MGCDLVLALGSTTAHGQTLVGLNYHGPAINWTLRRWPAATHVAEEKIHLPGAKVPQGRQTFAVVGCQAEGDWGLHHGINEHQLALGCARWNTKITATERGLTGTELVRLTLERSKTSSQALTVLTDLIARHGQGASGRGASTTDHIFLLADGREAYVVESAGEYWASMQCQRVRAMCDAGLIRQDWQRIAPGLAATAIAHGWWPDDGSKLDFGKALGAPLPEQNAALKRWGRASLLLEQQAGHLDLAVLRRLLAEHYDSQLVGGRPAPGAGLSACWTTSLAEGDAPAVAWWSFGTGDALTLPIFLDGELPPALERRGPDSLYEKMQAMLVESERTEGRSLRKAMDRLQSRIDHEAEEFLLEARGFKAHGETGTLSRLAGLFMQNYVELIEAEWRRWRGLPDRSPRRGVKADQFAYVAE